MRQKIRYFSFYILLPVLLFVLGFYSFFNYLKDGEFGITNLDVRTLDRLEASTTRELLKGDIVSGRFQSKYSNLGIVSLRFFNQDRDSKDTLVFRLREVGNNNLLYEAKYETDQFQPHKHFPFGFPIIKDSTGKDYEFQVESLRGATGSGIFVDYQQPVFIAKSSYTKGDLLKDGNLLIYFLSNKFLNIFGDPDILLNVTLFFLPLLIYIIFIASKGISYQYLTLSALALVLYDIFWLTKRYDFIFIGLVFLWGLISRRFRFESRIAAIFALGCLALTPIMLILRQDSIAEKSAVWAYLFLCITVIQQIYELKTRQKQQKLLTLNSFFRKFPNLKIEDDYWVKKSPGPIKKIAALSLLAMVVYILVSPIFLDISQSLTKFANFFPTDYVRRYIFTLILPEIILILFLSVLLVYSRKIVSNFKFALIFVLLAFNLISGKIISNSIKFENEPKILSVSPSQTSEAWTDVVITGKNFRNLPFVGKLYLNSVEQGEYMIYWSDEKIIFRTSPDLTKSGLVQVVPLDRSPSNKVHFEYSYK